MLLFGARPKVLESLEVPGRDRLVADLSHDLLVDDLLLVGVQSQVITSAWSLNMEKIGCLCIFPRTTSEHILLFV